MDDEMRIRNLELAVFHLTGAVNSLLGAISEFRNQYREQLGQMEYEGGPPRLHVTEADRLLRDAQKQLESAFDTVAAEP
jgi:hypothetical protein